MRTRSPGSLAGRYELERRLGAGGMAEVWLARDALSGGAVAVKFVLPGAGAEAREALAREASIGRQLQHPNIAALLDSGEDEDGQPYLVFEYVTGPSLREMIAWRGPLPDATVRDIGLGVAAALEYAHARGVVHNDLKPENILLPPTGPKVLDFGAADSLSRTVGPERARELMGTIAYLAPEVLQGADPSPASDVYALALTLYEARAGRLPFPGATPAAIAGQRLAGPAPALREAVPGADPELEAALIAALRSDPAQRVASAGQFARMLAAPTLAVTQPTVLVRRRARPEAVMVSPAAAAAPLRRRRWSAVVATTAMGGVLLAAGGLALALSRSSDPPTSTPEPTPDSQVLEVDTEPTATPTATPVPPTATPTPVPDEDSDGGNPGPGHGNGDKDNSRDKKGKDDKKNLFDQDWPTPPSRDDVEDAVSSFFDALRKQVRDAWENRNGDD
ncbi:MAG: serine/threonine-protein kinase [Hyphomicrobiales bacterium]